MTDVLERLAGVRQAVERACQLLLNPTPGILRQCTGVLDGAVAELSRTREKLRDRSSPELLTETRQLHSALHLTRELLNNAAFYYAGWDRIQRAMVGGYTGHGEAAAVAVAGTLQVEG